MKLQTHPRLYIDRLAVARAGKSPRLESLKRCADTVAQGADAFKGSPEFEWVVATHNAHLIRARRMQTRVVTLLTRWLQTDDTQYRDAAIEHVMQIGKWQYWSWITWRQGNADPMAIFDLSYGENSATLAIAYDLLYDELTDDQKKTIQSMAVERSLKPFLEHTKGTKPGERAWWMYHKYSNWNTVCAGGAGMLALAMYEHVSEAGEVLKRAEKSIKPYMTTLTEYNGAWPEGIGYWNYGMRYAFMYLLSHQNATGKRHPLMKIKGVKETLRFPIDFTPQGHGCSFGDVNHWSPLPFHYAAAHDLKQDEVIAELDYYLDRKLQAAYGNFDAGWPNAAELLLLHPGTKAKKPKVHRNVLTFYKGQDWGIVADRNLDSNLYATVRGGTTQVPHSHKDLTSYHLVVGDEHLVPSLGPGEYLDTTFSSRRWELPDMLPLTKNVMLINGVGITHPSTVKTTPQKSPQALGFHFDASDAMGESRSGAAVAFAGRTILMLRGKAMLIVDRSSLPHPARIESRLHSFADPTFYADWVKLTGEKEKLAVAYACNETAVICAGIHAPTTPPVPGITAHTPGTTKTDKAKGNTDATALPGKGANIIRWISQKLHTDVVMATLLVPGGRKPSVDIAIDRGQVSVRCGSAGLPTTTVRLTRMLKLKSK